MSPRIPGLCAACKRGDCDECYAADHPDMPDLYACHCKERGKVCPRPSSPAPDPDADLYLSLAFLDEEDEDTQN